MSKINNAIFHTDNFIVMAVDFIKASIAWLGIMFALVFIVAYVSTSGFLFVDWMAYTVESFGMVK